MTVTLGQRDRYDHRAVIVDGNVAVGTIYRSNGRTTFWRFTVFEEIPRELQDEVDETVNRIVALENITMRLTG